MCINFTPIRKAPWVTEQFGVDLPAAPYPVETYPGYTAPLVIQSHTSGRVACGLARFGLIPAWAKDDKISRHTYNARSETAQEKPSYRAAWKQRRYGIALVENFFEPSYVTGKAERWRIESASGDPFGIASLWETWTDPSSGELVTSFTMLTVNADAHPVMKQFHKPGDEKRTPVVLHPSQFKEWLSADTQQARAMMHWQMMPELTSQRV
jgi:putative SOS response-associated peptidase YedK